MGEILEAVEVSNEALGRQWHPNVRHYQSGGIGHLAGDESRSVVGFMKTSDLAPYREHSAGDDWRGDHSRQRVSEIKSDIESGVGIKEPITIDYDHKAGWGYIGEGNHRLKAAEEAGAPVVPVRVYGRSRNGEMKRGAGVGGPMKMKPLQDSYSTDPNYVPPDLHPAHLKLGR